MPDIKKIDKNFENQETKKELKYYNPKTSDNVKVYGLNWFDKDRRFIRCPKEMDETIKSLAEGLYSLVEQPSGGMIAFSSNTSVLKIKVKIGTIFNMGHMAFTGQGGCDLYISHENKFNSLTFFRCASYNITKKEYEFTYFDNWEKKDRMYLINLPLYGGIDDIEIGVDEESDVEPVDIFNNGRIVVYGTSITQGGCASRPGISYTNWLSRKLNYEVMNFGFSGNGRGQKEMADMVATIDNVKLFILDYEANATLDMLKNTLEGFIDSIRKYYPTVPILVLSKIRMGIETHNQEAYDKQKKSLNYQRSVVRKRKATDENIYFYDGHNLLGKYTTEATVDGCHPTDLGFMLITEALEKQIKKIL